MKYTNVTQYTALGTDNQLTLRSDARDFFEDRRVFVVRVAVTIAYLSYIGNKRLYTQIAYYRIIHNSVTTARVIEQSNFQCTLL